MKKSEVCWINIKRNEEGEEDNRESDTRGEKKWKKLVVKVF